MSDNKYNPTRPSKLTAAQQERNVKYVQQALNKSKLKPPPLTEGQIIIEKAKTLTLAVRKQIHPILAAGGWKEKENLRAILMTLYLQGLDSIFNRDDLIQLCAVMHTEAVMESIESDPFDSGKPDLLSGV